MTRHKGHGNPARMGAMQLDILDTLESIGPVSVGEVAEDIGAKGSQTQRALTRLRASGLVECDEADLWALTSLGREALQWCLDVGRLPGVAVAS